MTLFEQYEYEGKESSRDGEVVNSVLMRGRGVVLKEEDVCYY